MEFDNYPAIGQSVKYIRQNPNRADEQQILEGEGIIQAICLDASKRLVAHIVQDGQPGVNIDLRLLNPTEEIKEAFKTMTERVKSLEDEGNGKVSEIVAEYNQRVTEALNSVLGASVIL